VKVEGCEAYTGAQRARQGSNSVLKGQRRRGEEAMAGVLAING
jgi:hypothetical protein